jgi:DNA polymerase III delta' subunit
VIQRGVTQAAPADAEQFGVGERRIRTRGQAAAVAAAEAMLASHVPHALLLVGPAGVGKTTLALDLAAALLCVEPDAARRPCGTCRACRAVDHGNHPDLHRLGPTGAGAVIPIGGREERGVRDLISELALMPVEGGARVAIVEAAHRMTDDAQTALLKTLEEPPAGAVLILCADDEERLLPTVRSRCVRLRLGPVPRRDIETILIDRGLADAAAAPRLARVASGRPGIALAYAAAPDAAIARAEIARTILDLASASRTGRLTGFRDLAGRAAELVKALDAGAARVNAADGVAPALATVGKGRRGSRSAAGAATLAADDSTSAETLDSHATEPAEARSAVRVPASERRAAALALVAVWRDLLRDLAAVSAGEPRLVRDVELLDDLERLAGHAAAHDLGAALRRLDTAGERLEGNVSPELVLDVLALRHGS